MPRQTCSFSNNRQDPRENLLTVEYSIDCQMGEPRRNQWIDLILHLKASYVAQNTIHSCCVYNQTPIFECTLYRLQVPSFYCISKCIPLQISSIICVNVKCLHYFNFSHRSSYLQHNMYCWFILTNWYFWYMNTNYDLKF